MIDAATVNRIWPALKLAQAKLLNEGERRFSTSTAVDFIVDAAIETLYGTVTAEQVLYAWLYQALEMIALDAGVRPLPPRSS